MARVILLTGFAPFGGERTNPSWEVASWLAGKEIGGATIHTLELPVSCRRAAKMVTDAIARANPAAVLGLGQDAWDVYLLYPRGARWGAPPATLMSGSGSTVFALCRSPAEAQSITRALRSAREDGELARVSVVRSCD